MTKLFAILLITGSVVGCATVSSKEEQLAVSEFNQACMKAGGVSMPPHAQGSFALCKKEEAMADLYIHRDFLMVSRQVNQAMRYQATINISKTCSQEGGRYESSMRAAGGRLINHPDGLEKCTGSADNWVLSTSATVNASTQKREGLFNAFVRRGKGGSFDAKRLGWAVANVTVELR